MKGLSRKVLVLSVSSLITSSLLTVPSQASEPCFSKIPDSAWTYVSRISAVYGFPGSQPLQYFVPPSEVQDELAKFPKDYVAKIQRQVSKNNKDWVVVDKVSGDVRLPLVPGDRYRNVITYEGRNCTTRVVNMTELLVNYGKTPTLKEYVSKYSGNFQEEGEFLARITGPFPISFPAKELTAGDKLDVINSPELVSLRPVDRGRETRNAYPTIDFKDGCARVLSGPYADILPNTWRKSMMQDPQFEFSRSGVCKGEIYSYSMEGDLLPFLIGTIEYKVMAAKSSPKPVVTNKKVSITCLKGATTRKIVGINPKCPKGFRQK